MMSELKKIVANDVCLALDEDLKSGDVSGLLINDKQLSLARVLTRQSMVLAGKDWFSESIMQLDSSANIEWFYHDGDTVEKDQVLCQIKANSRSLLAAERVGLNFLQTLSGVATKTKKYVDKIKSKTKLLDTRKTLPNIRAAQKYAVLCGGGVNHRFGLYDAFLIKENHITACGSISTAIHRAQEENLNLLIEVEVENLSELKEALGCGVDRIMLDNFSIDDIKQAVKIRGNSQVELEVSGNVSLSRIELLSKTEVDYISVGDLTKSVEAIDLSLLVDKVFYD